MHYIDMKKMIYPLFAILLMCMASCTKEFPPTLKAVSVDQVTESTITCSCEIEDGEVLEAAFYYGTSKNSVSNLKSSKVAATLDGTVMRGEIKDLKPNTNYYIIGYGLNEKGQGVTQVVQVKTAPRVPGADDNLYPETTE